MKFQPLNKHVEVEPIEQTSIIATQNSTFEEKGKVISIASEVTLVAVGDVAFFDSWLVAKYSDANGNKRYLVPEEAIRAKETDEPLSE